MKANELRLGNYVIINTNTNEPFCMDYDAMHDTFIDNDFEDLHPIPLTEEWLQKFGFKKTDREKIEHDRLIVAREWNGIIEPLFDEEYEIDQFYQVYRNKGDNYSVKENEFNIYANIPIGRSCEYVHELQNLYFALTGNELQIK